MNRYLSTHMDDLRAAAASVLQEKSSHPWKEPGNKYEHGLRTATLALKLKADIGIPDDDCDPYILTAASWFHDVCNGQDEPDHENAGADLLPSLIGQYCSPEELAEIQRIIRVHDHRCKGGISIEERLAVYSPAVLLLQDADLIDHVGTYSVWATFSDLVYRHKTPDDYVEAFRNGAFERFAVRWRAEMNYPQALEIYNEKIAFEKAFAERMMRELGGEYC
ncbi:MAG: HD domain-containing protein [Clostridia bacterium]|nr:HD domain-containing protein [Clostridia bacterium]